MKGKFIAAAGAAVLVLAGGGVALASIPDSSGVIHGCYQPQSDGHNTPLSIIDTAKSHGSCPSDQTAITWNQTGPQGPAGAAGATGATGATGPQGPAGPGTAFDYGVLIISWNSGTGSYVCTLSHVGGPDASTITAVGNVLPGCEIEGVTLSSNPMSLFAPTEGYGTEPTTEDEGGGSILVEGSTTTIIGVSFIILP